MTSINRAALIKKLKLPAVQLTGLFGFFVILLFILEAITRPIIAEKKNQAATALMQEIVPATWRKVEFTTLDNGFTRAQAKQHQGHVDQPIYFAQTLTQQGYSGRIDLLIGFQLQANSIKIQGVRVIPPHHETPGLGDKIDTSHSQWIYSLSPHLITTQTKPWALKQNGGTFDAFTGATITPRAVIQQVYQFAQTTLQSAWFRQQSSQRDNNLTFADK